MFDEEDLVTIAQFDHLSEAEVAKALLEAEGIPAFVADSDVVNMEWLSVGGQQFELQVGRSHAEKAREIVETKDELPPEEAVERSETARCASCGADLPEGSSRCPACGWTYEQPGGTRAGG